MPRKPAAPKTSAPAVYDRATVMEAICARVAEGESLRKICLTEGMPDRRQVNRWLHEDEALQKMYGQAILERTDHYADEVIEIADTEKDPQKARNRIDARKWVCASMNRAKYGNKVGVDGGADGSPITVEIVRFGDKESE